MSWLVLAPPLLLALQAQAASPPAEEVNALSLLTGARFVDEGGTPSEVATTMLDGQPCTQYAPALSENLPLIIELAAPFELTRLEVINSSHEELTPGISVKTLRVERGAGPQGPWESPLEWTIQKGSQWQTRAVSLGKTRYLRVTLAANHGNTDWIGLSELRAWGRRSAPREVRFTGAWETVYGELRLTQAGQRITGCYGPPDSQSGQRRLEGTLRSEAFVGTWREEREDGSTQVGPLVLALTQEGDLSGLWGYTPSDQTQRWDGKKLAQPTITCEKPKLAPPGQAPAGGPQREPPRH